LPPVGALFDDIVEFGLGDTIAPARLQEHFAPDAMVAKTLGHSFSQFLTFPRSALIDCNDRHDTTSLAFRPTKHRHQNKLRHQGLRRSVGGCFFTYPAGGGPGFSAPPDPSPRG